MIIGHWTSIVHGRKSAKGTWLHGAALDAIQPLAGIGAQELIRSTEKNARSPIPISANVDEWCLTWNSSWLSASATRGSIAFESIIF